MAEPIVLLKDLRDELLLGFDFKDFFSGIMRIFGLTESYIDLAWDNDPRFNCANSDGRLDADSCETKLARPDIGIQKRALFRFVNHAEDVSTQLDLAISSPCFTNKKFNIPVVIVVSPDFIGVFNAIDNDYYSFELDKLPRYLGALQPLNAKYQNPDTTNSTQADTKASNKLMILMDRIESFNELTSSDRHALNDFMRRLTFCLFAEDTGLFDKGLFTKTFAKLVGSHGEGSERFFTSLFLVLNTPLEQRDYLSVSYELLAFPYVGGELFNNNGSSFIPKINFTIRDGIINCGKIDWNKISPAIFGAMFQYALDPVKRHEEGAHYTSEKNILKLIEPLFLDELTRQVVDLENEFQALLAIEVQKADKSAASNAGAKVRQDGNTTKNLNSLRKRAKELQDKLSNLKIMDPACGCGNFLIVAYRELRRLENRLLKLILQDGSIMQENLVKVSIEQFYGIEIEDWPVEIAHLSMWLMQHQMNLETAEAFGAAPPSLPLTKSAHIHCANALTTDWNEVLHASQCSYIIGNPPFGGKNTINDEQKAWLKSVYPDDYKIDRADFVTGWFVKAANYMQSNHSCRAAFVSTNSICQGQQVSTLWGLLLQQGIVINFAYTSFKWNNEAVNAAKVICIIVGFSYQEINPAVIFEEHPDGSLSSTDCQSISPQLTDKNLDFIPKVLHSSLSDVINLRMGNVPLDHNNLMLEISEGNQLLESQHSAAKYLKMCMGSYELCNNKLRYCLWLKTEEQADWNNIPFITNKVEDCRLFRENPPKASGDAIKYKATPWKFRSQVNPSIGLVIAKTYSENCSYIPMGIIDSNTVVTDLAFLLPNPKMYYYAILNSKMHSIWIKATCGRLGTGFRYSINLAYNGFIWPELNEQNKLELSVLGTRIFDFCSSSKMTLGNLNNPKLMPIELKLLHEQLDVLVESYYRPEPFADDNERLAFLIGLYRKRLDEVEQENQKSKSKTKSKDKTKVNQTDAIDSSTNLIGNTAIDANSAAANTADIHSVTDKADVTATGTEAIGAGAGEVFNADAVVPWITPLNAQHIMVTGSSFDDGGALQLDETQAMLLLSNSQKEASSYLHRLINSQAFYEYHPYYALWIDVAKEEAEEEERLKALAKAKEKAETKVSKSSKNKAATEKTELLDESRLKERITWRQIPAIMDQVEKCRVFRNQTAHDSLAYRSRFKAFNFSKITYPPLAQPKLMLPRFIRKELGYIPTWYSRQPYVIDDSVCIIPSHDIIDCALINSRMHWLWMEFTSGWDDKGICHYSIEKTYNTFIHPYVAPELRSELTTATAEFLNLTNCYAERYGKALDLASTSSETSKISEIQYARKRMDEIVERCYRAEGFKDDAERLEFMQQLYLKYKF